MVSTHCNTFSPKGKNLFYSVFPGAGGGSSQVYIERRNS